MDDLLKEIDKQWGKPAHCHNCKKGNKKLHFCMKCMASYYCGKECQTTDWNTKHKYECIGMKRACDEPEGEEEEEKTEKKPVVLTKDTLSIIMKFLRARDLKKVSLTDKKMSIVARREMLQNYIWLIPNEKKCIRDVVVNIAPRHIRIDRYKSYVKLITEYPEYYSRLLEIHFGYRCSFPDDVVVILPSNLIVFKFYGVYTNELVLPHSLKEFRMPVGYNEHVEFGPLLEKVYFNYVFNRHVVLPSSLKYVEFGEAFNQPVLLPDVIEEVHFTMAFNQPLILPSSIKELYFRGSGGISSFNQPLDLPKGIRVVQLSADFNQPIILPEGLKEIQFGRLFNQFVTIPHSVDRVVFRIHYDMAKATFLNPKTFVDIWIS